MVYRNIWLEKAYYNFCYSANKLNIYHVDLTVLNTELLNVWWNMLVKFSKQIAKIFAKIINGYNSKFKTLSNV